jgi:hypothetical protein
MLPQTRLIRESLIKKPLGRQIELLRDAYAGLEGYCVACGPSATSIYSHKHKQLAKDRVTFTIKQAISILPDCDFHLFNIIHLDKWSYSSQHPITVSTYNSRIHPTSDIEIEAKITRWLSQSCEWNEWTFDKTLTRPWGPGILMELGIYLWKHIGLKKVYIIGWDLGPVLDNNTIGHFYGSTKTKMEKGELQSLIEGSQSMYEWLRSVDVELVLVSDRSLLSKSIPRCYDPFFKLHC